ncbi:MAG: dihydroorotase [Pirellulaceae bacterium]|nr:dihydroorotase [Pirellulaceae bacterium]
MSSWLIDHGRLICPVSGLDRVGRLLIHQGVVAAIDPTDESVPAGAQQVDARGWIVAPGLIDLSTEIGEPGNEEDETIQSVTRAALAGGFTSIACAANTDPPIDTATAVEFIRQKAVKADRCRVHVIGCVSKGRAGEELAEIGSLVEAGAVALSDDPSPLSSAALLRRALEYCLMFDRCLLDRPEIPGLTRGGLMHEGLTQLVLALAPMPAEAEDLATARDLRLLEATGGRLHLSSISTAGSVELVRRSKSRDSGVSAGIRIANLCFDDQMMRSFDANLKVSPPLRSQEHLEACWEALADGTIDVLTSGHQPKALEKKMQELSAVPFGMSTLDTALAQVITYLIRPGKLDWCRAIEALTIKPAAVLGIPAGTLQVGSAADVVLIDPDAQWTVDTNHFYSLSHNTPLNGQSLYGRVEMAWVDGQRKFCRQ